MIIQGEVAIDKIPLGKRGTKEDLVDLTTGDIDFSGAQSQAMAGAARGLPVKVIGFRSKIFGVCI